MKNTVWDRLAYSALMATSLNVSPLNAADRRSCDVELADDAAAFDAFVRANPVLGEGAARPISQRHEAEWRRKAERARTRWTALMAPDRRCISDGTGNGLWVLRVDRTLTVDHAIAAEWGVYHVGSDGARARLPLFRGVLEPWLEGPDLPPVLFFSTLDYLLPELVAEDIDGDGTAELFVFAHHERHPDPYEDGEPGPWGVDELWGPRTRRGQLFRFSDGRVSLSDASRGFVLTDVRDVDGDGRRDVLTYGPFWSLVKLRNPRGPLDGSFPAKGPEFVGLHRGTGYDFGDKQVGLKYVAEQCARITSTCSGGTVDSVFLAIACARVRHADTAALSKQCLWENGIDSEFAPRGLWRKWSTVALPTDGARKASKR